MKNILAVRHNFARSKIGRAKRARRVKAMDGLQQPEGGESPLKLHRSLGWHRIDNGQEDMAPRDGLDHLRSKWDELK